MTDPTEPAPKREAPLTTPPGWFASAATRRTPKIGALALALSKAQGEFTTVVKDMIAGGGAKTYVYADLADFVAMTRGPLAHHGLAVIQAPSYTATGEVLIETGLIHGESDQELWNDFIMVPSAHDPQALGSCVTYARRYAYCAILGLVAEKDDDDGNKATGTDRTTARRGAPPQAPQNAPRRDGPRFEPPEPRQDPKQQAAAFAGKAAATKATMAISDGLDAIRADFPDKLFAATELLRREYGATADAPHIILRGDPEAAHAEIRELYREAKRAMRGTP